MRCHLAESVFAVVLLSLIIGCNDEAGSPEFRAEDANITYDVAVPDDAVKDGAVADMDSVADQSFETDSLPTPCVPVVPPEATRRPGVQDDGSLLTVTGRGIAQYGRAQSIEGFPSNLLLHPELPVAYVVSTSHDDRDLHVISTSTLEIIQTIQPNDLYAGMQIDLERNRLMVAGGDGSSILIFEVQSNGTLADQRSISVDGYVAYISFDAVRNILWYTRWDEPLLHSVDLNTGAITQTIELEAFGWQMHQHGRRLMVSSMLENSLISFDMDTHEQLDIIALPGGVASMCAIDQYLYLALSDMDMIGRIQLDIPVAPEIVPVAADFNDAQGQPYANSNVNGLACDANSVRVYASRGADNIVGVFDGISLDQLGLIPTGAYPNEVLIDGTGQHLWVAEGHGGTGPSMGRTAKNVISGALRTIPLSNLDLVDATETSTANYLRPKTVFPFECDGFFPIPSKPGQSSPIEHVILIVKENKTFDCVFGDLDPSRADVDPSLTLFGREITPNLHALADQFALSDNFYTEVEDSDIGHIILTAAHLTEYVQRIWIEKDHARQLAEGYQVTSAAVPKVGNFFTHLMEHEISLKIMGEVVGINVYARDNLGQVGQHIDLLFPGGGFVNYRVKDEVKARRLVEIIEDEALPAFTYILLPNDHTVGTRVGYPTPESMVADNDYAVGLIVDALSHSPYWMKSAAIILQDDPQGCRDHVDVHRSPLLVVSPWSRRGYISHARASFMAVFNTMERILGVPPMARGDASAAPLWDMFSANAEPNTYTAIPPQIPEQINGQDSIGAELSARMDFRGPDRNPSLGPLLEVYMAHRTGKLSKKEAEAKLQNMEMGTTRWLKTMEESVEEKFSFDEGIESYHDYLDARGLSAPRYPANGFNLGPNFHP